MEFKTVSFSNLFHLPVTPVTPTILSHPKPLVEARVILSIAGIICSASKRVQGRVPGAPARPPEVLLFSYFVLQ